MGEALAAAGFRAVGPLLPGHGTTPEDLYITTGADLLRAAETALLSLRGARRIFLCGLSAGALLAVHLAARSWSHEGLPDFSAIALLAPAIEFRGSSWIFANVFGRLPALPFILGKGGRDIAAGEADEREKVDGFLRRHPPPLGGRAARALAGRREPRAARPRACAPPPRRARSHGRARLLAQALAHARVHAGGGPAVPAQRPRASAGRRVGRGLPRGGHVLPGSRLMARYLLAIDQGTTGTTVAHPRPAALRSRRRRTSSSGRSSPGRAGSSTISTTSGPDAEAIGSRAAAGGGEARRSAAIGITNQRETTLLWDRHSGRPIHNAIVWQDRRTADLLRRLQRRRARSVDPGEDGPGARPVLLRDEAGLAAGARPGRAARAENGDLAFGTIDSCAALAAHRRRGARDRRDERFPHAADRSERRAWDPTSCSRSSASPGRRCRRSVRPPECSVPPKECAGCRTAFPSPGDRRRARAARRPRRAARDPSAACGKRSSRRSRAPRRR